MQTINVSVHAMHHVDCVWNLLRQSLQGVDCAGVAKADPAGEAACCKGNTLACLLHCTQAFKHMHFIACITASNRPSAVQDYMEQAAEVIRAVTSGCPFMDLCHVQEQLEQSQKEKEDAEKETEHIRRQYKSLENSYDELASENLQLKGGHKPSDKKGE